MWVEREMVGFYLTWRKQRNAQKSAEEEKKNRNEPGRERDPGQEKDAAGGARD